ncbi:MAG: hypothetical protein C0444_03940 [Microbacterium sp.]|nr:hypothetical protein [Microbacterium sp.]MBA4346960.1 hypothetical protein [Microbacterium sp.]
MILPVVLSAIGLCILLVRFPPSDLVGWLASAFATTLGVPVLFASALLYLSSRMLKGHRPWGSVRIALFGTSLISALVGASLLFTFP